MTVKKRVIFKAFHGAVFSCGALRFGHTAPYDFASENTAPHRTEEKKKNRTAP